VHFDYCVLSRNGVLLLYQMKERKSLMKITHTKDNDAWEMIKLRVPTIHIYKNIYLVRQYTYEHHKIAKWIIFIVERKTSKIS